jgi:hypothetical protein
MKGWTCRIALASPEWRRSSFAMRRRSVRGIPHYQLEAFYETCIKPRKARLDLEYMERATLWTDIKLLWRTAASCAFGPDNLSSEETAELTRLAAELPDPFCGKRSNIYDR